jgi:hypothetical protein
MSSDEVRVMLNGSSDLNRRSAKLEQMIEALSDTDKRWALEAVNKAHEAGDAVDAFLTLAKLFSTMAGAADKEKALKSLSMTLRLAMLALNVDIQGLDGTVLPSLQNPAALSEATAIRDRGVSRGAR